MTGLLPGRLSIRTSRWMRPVLFLVAAGLSILFGFSLLQAQEVRSNAQSSVNQTVEGNLRQAKQQISEGNLQVGLDLIQQILSENRNEIVSHPEREGLYVNVGQYIRQYLPGLSDSQRESYRDLYNEDARAALEELPANPSLARLNEIFETYPLTAAGADALFRIIRRHHREGSFLQARNLLRTLLEVEYRPEVREKAQLQLIQILGLIGDEQALERYRDELPEEVRQTNISRGDQSRTVEQFIREMIEKARNKAGSDMGTGRGVGPGLSWPSPGGSSSGYRIQGPIDSLQSLSAGWTDTFSIGASRSYSRVAYGSRGHLLPDRRSNPNNQIHSNFLSRYPVVSGGFLFVSNGREARAYSLMDDLTSPGEPHRQWTFEPETGLPENYIMSDTRMIQGGAYQEGTYFTNLVTGTEETETQLRLRLRVMFPLPKRTLFAIDSNTGDVLWRRGGEGETRSFFQNTSFPTPPVVHDGVVYTSMVRRGSSFETPDHYAVALDAETGKRLWSQFLSKETLGANLFGNPISEVFHAPPAVHRDSVFLSTNAGEVIRLDRSSGHIEWMYRYLREPFPEVDRFRPNRQEHLWNTNALIHQDHQLLVTPTDSPYLLILDSRTGEIQNKVHQHSYRMSMGEIPRWLIPAGENRFALAGDTRFGLFQLDQPSQVLGDAMVGNNQEEDLSIQGRPAVTEEKVLLPEESGVTLYQIKSDPDYELERPEEQNQEAWETTGNVFATAHSMVILAPEQISVRLNPNKITDYLERQLEKHPQNRYLQYQHGEFLAAAGMRDRAMNKFRRLHDQLQTSGRSSREDQLLQQVRQMMVRTLLETGEQLCGGESTGSALDTFREARTFADSPDLLYRIRSSAADCYLSHDEYQNALSEYNEYLSYLVENGFEKSGHWQRAYERIREITSKGGSESYRPLEQKARSYKQNQVSPQNRGDVERMFWLFPNSKAVRRAFLEHARYLEEQEKPGEATDILFRVLRESRRRSFLITARKRLVEIFMKRNEPSSALYHLEQLERHHGNQSIPGIDSGQTVSEWVTEQKQIPDLQTYIDRRNRGIRLPLEKQADIETNLGSGARMIRNIPDSRVVFGYITLYRDNNVTGISTARHEVEWTTQTEESIQRGVMLKDTVILFMDARITALRLSDGSQKWSVDTGDLMERYEVRNRMLYTAERPDGRIHTRIRMSARNLNDGSVLWEKDLNLNSLDYFRSSENTILIADENQDEYTLLDRSNGSIISNRVVDMAPDDPASIGFQRLLLFPEDILVALGDPARPGSDILDGLMVIDMTEDRILQNLQLNFSGPTVLPDHNLLHGMVMAPGGRVMRYTAYRVKRGALRMVIRQGDDDMTVHTGTTVAGRVTGERYMLVQTDREDLQGPISLTVFQTSEKGKTMLDLDIPLDQAGRRQNLDLQSDGNRHAALFSTSHNRGNSLFEVYIQDITEQENNWQYRSEVDEGEPATGWIRGHQLIVHEQGTVRIFE